MNWQILIAISILTESVGRIIQRFLLKEDNSNPIAFAVIFQLLTGILLLIFAVILGINFSLIKTDGIVSNLILMPFLFGMSNIFIFKSLKNTEASLFTVFFTTRALWIILIAVLALDEAFTARQILGTILILLSILIIMSKNTSFRISKGGIYALLAAVFMGGAIINDAIIINQFKNVPFYVALSFIAPSIFIWAINPRQSLNILQITRSTMLYKIGVLSIVYGIAAMTYLMSYTMGAAASQIGAIYQTTSIVTVGLAIVFLKETKHLYLKLLAVLVSFIGILLIK